MPNGPGIDQGQELLDSLEKAGLVRKTAHADPEPFREYRSKLSPSAVLAPLSPEAERAIREAVATVGPMSAAAASEFSHEYSKSWRAASGGEELNIYADPIPVEDYEQPRDDGAKASVEFASLFTRPQS